MAKLLYQRRAAGRGEKSLEKTAGSMSMTRVKLDIREAVKTRAKPGLFSEKARVISPDRESLPSVERLVLKNRPAKSPVRKINMNMSPIFFIGMSPFSSVKEYAQPGIFMTWKKEENFKRRKIIVNRSVLLYNSTVISILHICTIYRVRREIMYTDEFAEYLQKDRKMSKNTLEAYNRDVQEFVSFEGARGITDIADMSSTEIIAFLHTLKTSGKSAATVNRKLASVRAFFNYLIHMGLLAENPTAGIKSPKIERKKLEYLSMEEMDRLLSTPDESIRGIRDRAILEVMYATGIRVSELIEANVEDINLRMGFITCAGDLSKARIVPLGRPARAALENYIYDSRDRLLKENREEKALFVNYNGKRITRQGLWKILKEYGGKAGVSQRLTPNIIRNSFAVHMLQNGADLKSLQELMGHEDITATQAYLAVTKNRIKDVYDKTHPRA